MKKAILIIACAFSALTSFAQNKLSVKSDTTSKIYSADPKRLYHIDLTSEQINSLLQTSQAGVLTYLKAIKLPMDKLDAAQAYFNTIAGNIAYQYREQFVADSLRSLKHNVKK